MTSKLNLIKIQLINFDFGKRLKILRVFADASGRSGPWSGLLNLLTDWDNGTVWEFWFLWPINRDVQGDAVTSIEVPTLLPFSARVSLLERLACIDHSFYAPPITDS